MNSKELLISIGIASLAVCIVNVLTEEEKKRGKKLRKKRLKNLKLSVKQTKKYLKKLKK